MKNRFWKSGMNGLLLTGVSAMAAPAWAQQAVPNADEQVAAMTSGNDIVVTAQKREESLQNVPISIAAFGGEGLAQANIKDVGSLPRLVPNFSVARGSQVASVRLNIRGIGAAGNNAAEPSVATFVDGLYVPRPGAVFATFYDIASVEVLRGPQGTLFGRNASVGAVSMHTVDPEQDFTGRIAAEYGTGERYRLEGYVNVPVTDTLSVRASGLMQLFDGLYHNRLDGQTFGGIDTYAGRLGIKFEPTSELTWTVKGEYTRLKGNPFRSTELLPQTLETAGLARYSALLDGNLPDLNPFDRTTNNYIQGSLSDRQWSVSSALDYEFSAGWTVRLLDGYRDWDSTQYDADVVFSTRPFLGRIGAFRSKSHSHELQFISPTDQLLGGKLDFVAGLYYFNEKYRIGERLDFLSDFCPVLIDAIAPAFAAPCAAGPQIGATDQSFHQKVDSYAAYAQTNFAILDTLDVVLGGRWSKDDKRGRFDQVLPNPVGALLRAAEGIDLTFKDDKFTWRAGLVYKPMPELMTFATYSTGFKSGGFNSSGGTPALGSKRIFDSETVDNYELGFRAEIGNAFRWNLTAFRMDIKGFQDRSFDGVSFVVRNAGNLRQQGIETDGYLKPASFFRFNYSLAYLDSKFTDFKGASGLPGIGGVQDLTGARATYSPKLSGVIGMQLDGALGSRMNWALRTDMNFTSDVNVSLINDRNQQTEQDGYETLSARLTLFGPDDRWSLAVFGENLLKTRYCDQSFYQTLDGALGFRNPQTGGTAVLCFRGDPRTLGVAASLNF